MLIIIHAHTHTLLHKYTHKQKDCTGKQNNKNEPEKKRKERKGKEKKGNEI